MPREKLREYGTGEWTVKFYYDGQLYRENSFIFTVTNPSHMEKIYAVPDYSQTDTVYGGIPGGENYCGPVSVSNSLMWLDDNGFDNLAPNTDDRKKDQFDMIINLGFNYMNTDDDGTGVDELMAGAKKYLSDSGYNNFQLQYQGWRYNSSEFATGIDIPNLEWIKNGTEDTTGSVWLNIYDENTDEYNRTGGHWVTLVGYGYNGNPDYLILHDPSTCFANDFVLPVQIINGNLTGNYKGLPRSATGFYEMDNMRSDKLAILDGAVILKMNPVTILPDWVNISGNITTSDGTPLCAMVLANGQYMFSCSPAGRYSLYVPADDNGQITLFAFCDGLPPFKQIITPYQKTVISDIKMGTGTGFPMVITTQSDKNGAKPGWIKIWGTVTYNGTPLCAMILANGQHMFSCGDNQGKYELEVPLDADGQITLFGFCEGLQPFKKVFNP